MLKFSRITWILIGVLAAVGVWKLADAQTINVQHNGTSQFCATSLASIDGANWNFTGTCTPPATRQLTATLTYVPPGGQLVTGVTECDQLVGRARATDPVVPFPGRSNAAPVINNFGRGNYIGCHFRAPTNGTITIGWLAATDYNYSFDLTSAISPTLGDFSPSGSNCVKQSFAGALVQWTTTPAQHRAACAVIPGRDYYYMMKPTNPAQARATCPATRPSCVVGLTNNIGG